ncbi:MAG: hypothetical protein QM535_05115 [Limnohabitans sp.]|nr:hypothetical protein [Limnohabitans sp.]
MKTQIKKIGLLLVTSFSLLSCSKDNEVNETVAVYKPTAQKLRTLRDDALGTVTQNFTLTSGNNSQQFTSTKGVKFTIIRSNLSLNGNPVTGDINIKFAEIFDGGKMLTTNKTTMGIMPDNNKAIMKSGGEFYINATAGGQQLNLNAPINVEIPSNLTGGVDPAMLLWNGVEDPQGGVDWRKAGNAAGTNGGVDNQNGTYYTVFNQFGWTNVDRFYSDPRPKTTIQATVPSGYDNTNCSIYLHYDGEGNALARLDTYNSTTGIFSEHYGQIPIGLVCHIIFATEDNGQWRYAIKAVTITAGATYNFSLSETTLGTESQLVAAINALP